jgi:hypothetical protein
VDEEAWVDDVVEADETAGRGRGGLCDAAILALDENGLRGERLYVFGG